jgi:hypothetical protein
MYKKKKKKKKKNKSSLRLFLRSHSGENGAAARGARKEF